MAWCIKAKTRIAIAKIAKVKGDEEIPQSNAGPYFYSCCDDGDAEIQHQDVDQGHIVHQRRNRPG